MTQFEIWWADFPGATGRCPVLLLSRNDAYGYLNKFVVAEITTTIRGIPVEVHLDHREGMSRPCVANCDNLRTVPKEALTERAGKLSQRRVAEAKRAVGYALGWDELIEIADVR